MIDIIIIINLRVVPIILFRVHFFNNTYYILYGISLYYAVHNELS